MKVGIVALLGVCVALTSCQRAQIYSDAREKANVALMEIEAPLLATYFHTKDFHGKLIMECPSPHLDPYPQMTNALDTMWSRLSQIQACRGQLYAETSIIGERQKRISKKQLRLELEELHEKEDSCLMQFSTNKAAFNIAYARYDSLRNAYGIRFISHADYADSLLRRIIIWQDSLEVQGRRIAQALTMLKQVVPDQNSEDYKRFYQPISEMQLLHKELQNHLTGAENAMNRYQAGPQDEGYFTGPHLVERYDVNSTEAIFEKMRQNMHDFRMHEREFLAFVRR